MVNGSNKIRAGTAMRSNSRVFGVAIHSSMQVRLVALREYMSGFQIAGPFHGGEGATSLDLPAPTGGISRPIVVPFQ